MHPIYLQSISTAKFLFEEERRTTTLDSAGCHDCNSITKNIGLLMVIVNNNNNNNNNNARSTSIKCVVRRMVRSLFKEVSKSHMPRRASGSIPLVGSSSITTWIYSIEIV